MIKFKKGYNSKIASLLVAIIFLSNSFVYGISLSTKSHLRVPVINNIQQGKERLIEALSRLTYHDYVNEYLAKQAEAKYIEFLKSQEIDLSLKDNEEIKDKFYNMLKKYPDSEIAILPMQGLYKNTAILEQIGLGRFYGKPIIYIDSSLEGKDKEEILQHAYNEITKWDEKRKELGLNWSQMRKHILDNYEEFKQFSKQTHEASYPIGHILAKYKAKEKNESLDIIATMPFKEGDIVIAAGETMPRRDFIRKVIYGITGVGVAALPFSISSDLSLDNISIVSLLNDTGERIKKPYLGKDYFMFGGNIFSQDGKWLGFADNELPMRIIDIETNRTIGCFNWTRVPKGKTYIYDITGKPIKLEIDMKNFDSSGKPTTIYVRGENGRLLKAGYFVREYIPQAQLYIEDLRGRKVALVEDDARLAYTFSDGFILQAIMGIDSLSHYFFIQPASEKIYKELKQTIDNFNPIELNGKVLKVELTRRLIEIEIELGIAPDIIIKKSDISNTYHRIKNIPLERLNKFNDPYIKKVIWNAIANAYPQFRLYYEAVKRLGLEDDTEMIQESLEILKKEFKSWTSVLKDTESMDTKPVFNEAVKNTLCIFLRFNSLSTSNEIISYCNTLFNEKEGPIRTGEYVPSFAVTAALINAAFPQKAGYSKLFSFTSFFRAIVEISALRREGYETYFVIGNNYAEVGDSKMPNHEYFVIFKNKTTNDWYAIDTSNFISKKGLEVKNGLYQIKDIENIKEELKLRAINKIAAENFYLPRSSMKEYLTMQDLIMQEEYDDFPDNPSIFSSLSFHDKSYIIKRTEKAISIKYLEMFETLVKRYGINIEIESGFKEIEKMKINFVKSALLLPEKFMFSLKNFKVKEKIPLFDGERRAVKVDSLGVVYGEIKNAAGLQIIGSQTIEQADPALVVTIHEFMHNWEDVTSEDIKGVFYSISWGKSKIRKADIDNFVKIDAMTNCNEDLADTGQDYVMNAVEFRKKARESMKKGKFELVTKYLFVKYVILKDYDSKFFEYRIDSNFQPMTIGEVELAIKESNIQIPEHILETIRKIKELAYNGKVYGKLEKRVNNSLGLAILEGFYCQGARTSI